MKGVALMMKKATKNSGKRTYFAILVEKMSN